MDRKLVKVSASDGEVNAASRKVLKWAGSKAGAAKQILPYLDFSKTYIEPFCGSAAFYFLASPRKSYLNDSNANLIQFYKHIVELPVEVWRKYNGYKVSAERYYELRSRYNKIESGVEKSALFLYLNHFGFNGIYRTNASGDYNTPFGASQKPRSKMRLHQLVYAAKHLSGACLSSLDFEKFLKKISPRDSCIYMDPPYFTKEERVFGEYGKMIFGQSDLLRLYHLSVWLSKRGNRIVISYKNCHEFTELFSNQLSAKIEVQRNVGGFAGRRKSDLELLAVFK